MSDATKTPIVHPTPARREEIKQTAYTRASLTAIRRGLGDWIQEAARTGERHQPGNTDILTDEESDAVFALWADMPGSASWADAFLRWLGETDAERRERHRTWAVLSGTEYPGDQEHETQHEV